MEKKDFYAPGDSFHILDVSLVLHLFPPGRRPAAQQGKSLRTPPKPGIPQCL